VQLLHHNLRQRLQAFQIIQIQPLEHEALNAHLLQLSQLLPDLLPNPDKNAALAQFAAGMMPGG